MAMRYKLSRVLQAIATDSGCPPKRRNEAYVVVSLLISDPQPSFNWALNRHFRRLPFIVGVDGEAPLYDDRPEFAPFAQKIHDLLVAEAKRLHVEMEDC